MSTKKKTTTRKRKRKTIRQRELTEHLAGSALSSAALLLALGSLLRKQPFPECVDHVAEFAHVLLHMLEDEADRRTKKRTRKR